MKPIFLLSVPGSGTIYTMRQLTALGYHPTPEPGYIQPGHFAQLHTLSPGAAMFTDCKTVVPLRHPHDVFRTMYGRGIDVGEIVAHYQDLIKILAATRDCAFLDITSDVFVDMLAMVCEAYTPETIDLSPANFTILNHDKIARIKEGEDHIHSVDFALDWYKLVCR